ncbi:hypothetical protein HPB49_001506 [Dermacentor silvarum]|uniref:Uncharacterized protein n=1 Tax=Dermacentor silvarum TaxID=543639 RepID=A0ACB8CP00_DERSI|nr:hypothetical protein HPB49_001506 [Dermacentor silvarum]
MQLERKHGPGNGVSACEEGAEAAGVTHLLVDVCLAEGSAWCASAWWQGAGREVVRAVLEAADAEGVGGARAGYSRVQSNTAYGVRMGPSTCFLNEMMRPNITNLHIYTYSTATKIIFEGNRATGVEFVKDGKTEKAYATREVILCAGAVNTPKLLMLSGIGPKHELERHDVYDKYYKPMFGKNGFMNAVAMVKPKSRGAVYLRSKKPEDKPHINPNMLSENIDLTRIVNGTLKLLGLFDTKAMKDIGAEVWKKKFPYCSQFDVWSPDYVTCFVQHTAFPGQHVCCTCAMGEHQRAVVDSSLRVKNTEGLRVVDASVMPQIVSGNTYATVLMIGAKAADMILQDAKKNPSVKP